MSGVNVRELRMYRGFKIKEYSNNIAPLHSADMSNVFAKTLVFSADDKAISESHYSELCNLLTDDSRESFINGIIGRSKRDFCKFNVPQKVSDKILSFFPISFLFDARNITFDERKLKHLTSWREGIEKTDSDRISTFVKYTNGKKNVLLRHERSAYEIKDFVEDMLYNFTGDKEKVGLSLIRRVLLDINIFEVFEDFASFVFYNEIIHHYLTTGENITFGDLQYSKNDDKETLLDKFYDNYQNIIFHTHEYTDALCELFINYDNSGRIEVQLPQNKNSMSLKTLCYVDHLSEFSAQDIILLINTEDSNDFYNFIPPDNTKVKDIIQKITNLTGFNESHITIEESKTTIAKNALLFIKKFLVNNPHVCNVVNEDMITCVYNDFLHVYNNDSKKPGNLIISYLYSIIAQFILIENEQNDSLNIIIKYVVDMGNIGEVFSLPKWVHIVDEFTHYESSVPVEIIVNTIID